VSKVFIEDIEMFRILGFLIGSASSIAIILLVMGMPEFHARDAASDQQRFDDAVEKLIAKKQLESSVPEEVATDPPADPLVEQPQRETVTTALSVADTAPAVPAEVDETTAEPDEPALLNEMQWYSFWNPFRSEIAAKGFVAQLERVTGIDYRVVKIKPGVYEVAFAYDDDAERHAKLSQISAATGLDLPGS
jgi:hypothetical protein